MQSQYGDEGAYVCEECGQWPGKEQSDYSGLNKRMIFLAHKQPGHRWCWSRDHLHFPPGGHRAAQVIISPWRKKEGGGAKRWHAYIGKAVTFQEAPAAVMAQNDVTRPLLPPRAAGRETWPSPALSESQTGARADVRFQPSAPLGAHGLGTRPALPSFCVWSAQTGSVGRPCELY